MENTTSFVEREEEIANCLETGRTASDIEKEYAVKWNVTPRTIARYIQAVKGKKNGQDRTDILSDPEIEAKLSAGQTIELYNYLGQKVLSAISCEPSANFDISDQPNGIYLIRILNKNGTIASEKKIIKIE